MMLYGVQRIRPVVGRRCPSPKPRPADKSLICQLRSGDNPGSMITLLLHLLRLLPFLCGGHRQLALENLVLRQQLAVYKRTAPRPRLRTTDRLLWVGLARVWAGWRQALVIVSSSPSAGGACRCLALACGRLPAGKRRCPRSRGFAPRAPRARG